VLEQHTRPPGPCRQGCSPSRTNVWFRVYQSTADDVVVNVEVEFCGDYGSVEYFRDSNNKRNIVECLSLF
jgi:hypothetical protein